MIGDELRTGPLDKRAEIVGIQAAAPAATSVDQQARFPHEAMAALREQRLLAVAVPADLGGEDASLGSLAGVTRILAQSCASTAMIFAMHQIQVLCIVRHGANQTLQALLREVATDQLLLASATSEVNVGGDVRTSICALDRMDGRFRLEKQAPVVSYGAYADAVLATARRGVDSPPSDQVLVCCRGTGLQLEATGEWDTLGFRGTCSNGYRLVGEGSEDLILTDPYGDISSRTMLPVSHILWASVWLGLAEAAGAKAHRYVRAAARRQPGVVPTSATRLAELAAKLQEFRGLVRAALQLYEEGKDDPEALGSLRFAVAMNSLKISASTLVVEVVAKAMSICGMAGYRQHSDYSLGRELRDAYGAALMVNNDRVIGNSAQLLLASKEI